MDTITQNWLWFASFFGIGVLAHLLYTSRHSARGDSAADDDADGLPPSGNDGGRGGQPCSPPEVLASTVDPVTGQAVRTAKAPAFFYRGRVYFFASTDSRDRFEAAPHKYIGRATFGGCDGPLKTERQLIKPRSRAHHAHGGHASAGAVDVSPLMSSVEGDPNQRGARDGH